MDINLGKFDHDLTVLPNPGNHGLDIGKSAPLMAELFRLVKYYFIYPDRFDRLRICWMNQRLTININIYIYIYIKIQLLICCLVI